jgi:hypothetical protein
MTALSVSGDGGTYTSGGIGSPPAAIADMIESWLQTPGRSGWPAGTTVALDVHTGGFCDPFRIGLAIPDWRSTSAPMAAEFGSSAALSGSGEYQNVLVSGR